MTAKYSTILLLVSTLVLFGCSGSSFNPVNPPTIHAGPPPAFGCTVPADFPTSQESPGSSLSLVDFPCALLGAGGETDIQRLDSCGKNQVVTATLAKDLHVHSVRMWIGAGKDTTFETGMCLEIITAGIVTHTFRREWDKHIEEHYADQPFAVDFIIPAGSLVRLSRDPHATILCNDGTKDCVTQEMAELSGE